MLAVLRDHHGPAPHVDAAAHREAAIHGIAERSAVGVVHEREQLADFVACGIVTTRTDQCLCCKIHVVDKAIVVGRDDPFGDRLQCVLGFALAARQRHLEALALADVASDRQHCRAAVKLDSRTLGLDPQAGLLAIDQLDFETTRRLLAFEAFRNRIAKQRAISGLDQVRDVAADQLRGLHADQRCGGLVGQQYPVIMNNHDLGQRPGKVTEQAVPTLDLLVAFPDRIK